MTNRWILLGLVGLASLSLHGEVKDDHDQPGKTGGNGGPAKAGPTPNPAPGAKKAGGPPPPPAKVKPAGLCEKLYRFTCAPGEYDDGTGVGRSKDIVVDKVTEIKKDETKNYVERFKAELLKTPRLKTAAIAAFDLADSPDCQEHDEEDEKKLDEAGQKKAKAKLERCNKTLAESLAEMSLDRLLAIPGQNDFGGQVHPFGPSLRGTDYLLNNPAFKRVEAELGGKIREKLVDKKAASAIEKEIFPEVRDSIVALIEKLVKNPQDRKKLIAKVKGIEFGGTDCDKLHGNAESSLIGSLLPNAYYSPLENTFRYCNGYLMQSTSRFQSVHVIAHELSHAFDPCNIAMDMEGSAVPYADPTDLEQCEKEFPFSGIIGCLRHDESVGASRRPKRNDPLFGPYGGWGGTPGGGPPIPPGYPDGPSVPKGEGTGGPSGPLGPDPILFPPSPPETGKKTVPPAPGKAEGGEGKGGKDPKRRDEDDDEHDAMGPNGYRGAGSGSTASPFCAQDDQVTEAFADRIADEVLPDYIEKHYLTPPEGATKAEQEKFVPLDEDQVRTGYSNVFRGACPRKGAPQALGHDVHPETEKRVDRSLLVHPSVRKQMGCQEEPPEGRRFCPLVAAEVPKGKPKQKDKEPKKNEPPVKRPLGGGY